MNRAVIAIDGPAGSGKSTVSRAVAERLGWSHLDTGAFYRAAAVAVARAGADRHDEAEVVAIIRDVTFDQRDGSMFLDGEDVSEAIRTDHASEGASIVSAHPAVRRILVGVQRVWASRQPRGSVAEGRDMGTVVFPEAGVKVFLTAQPAERARRRAAERGGDERAVASAMEARDRLDTTRSASPLKPVSDAVVIDTTTMTIDEVVERLAELASDAGLA